MSKCLTTEKDIKITETSEAWHGLPQLFTQALEMLISWSSSDCIPDSGVCTPVCEPLWKSNGDTKIQHGTEGAHSMGLKCFCPVQSNTSLKRAYIPSSWGGEVGRSLLWWNVHSSSICFAAWEGSLRGGGSVVLHKGDGCQLLAKLFQHDHALQQGDMVHPAKVERATGQSG